MAQRRRRRDAPRALQYGPTEGIGGVKDVHRARSWPPRARRVDPDDILVTTGGQQVIDLVCKTLIDPGDVIIAEAPTYPGAVPAFMRLPGRRRADRDGRRRHARSTSSRRRSTASTREGRAPKFIYTIPTFQNPAGVTMSLPRRKRLVEVARERELLVLEDNPYGLLRYEGDPLPTLLLARRRRSSSSTSARSRRSSRRAAPRLGGRAAARCCEKMNIGKQGADLCSSSLTQLFVADVLRASGRWQDYLRLAARALPPPARHDARRAGRALPARGDVDAARRAACSSGRRCPTTSTRPTCWRARCEEQRRVRPRPRRVPRRPRRLVDAAELLRRRRGRHPRGRPAHRRGRRASRSSSTARSPAQRARPRRRAPSPRRGPTRSSPTSCTCRSRGGARRAAAERRMSRVAVLKGGRSLERQVSLQLRRARRGRARAPRPRGRRHRRRPRPRRAPARARARRRVRRAARPRRRGRHRPGAARDRSAIPYTGSRRRRRACAAPTRSLAKHAMRDAGIPTPDFFAFSETAFKELGAADALPAIEERLGVPDRRQARRPGLGARASSSRATPPTCPAALVAAFSYSRQGPARAPRRRPRPRGLDPRRRARCRSSRRSRSSEDFYDFEARYEIGRTDVRLPGRARRRGDRARAGARARTCTAARLPRLRARRPACSTRDSGELHGARGQRRPGPDRDEPAAAGRRRRGDRVRRARRADRCERSAHAAPTQAAAARGGRLSLLARRRSPRA